MNLTQLTALIGKETQKRESPLESKIVYPHWKLKETEHPYAVFMAFDLDRKRIVFERPIPYSQEIPKRFYYFGNNKSAQSQTYVVRETQHLHYLLTSVWNDLHLSLNAYGMADSALACLLREMQQENLLSLGRRKGEGSLNMQRFFFPGEGKNPELVLDSEKKGVLMDGEKYTFEAFVKRMLGDEIKQNRYLLVIPKVYKGEQEYILSQMTDYLELVKRINKLSDEAEQPQAGASDGDPARVCHICLERKPDVSSTYTTKFSRTGINKFFVTKKTNFSRNLIHLKSYDDNYAICNRCYQELSSGESAIERHFKTKIAGEDAFILPEGLLEDFSYEEIDQIRKNIDFAFHGKSAKEWLQSVETAAWERDFEHYSVNIVVYRTDGTSITLLEVIEDIPALRYLRIMELFSEQEYRLKQWIAGFSLGTVYHMIPVNVSKSDRKQVDIRRILTLYKSLLSGYQIEREVLFAYFCDALDKGSKQLQKDEFSNYFNLELHRFRNRTDLYIRQLVFRYLALMQAIQSLGILNRLIFIPNEERSAQMADAVARKHWFETEIQEMEEFLNRQGFLQEAKALFYLGSLVYQVGEAQRKKGHEQKPILKKINFQGMNVKDIIRLYEEVVEKLRQYDAVKPFSELLMNRFHHYFGNLEKKWGLTDHANIFYIMAGYAYLAKYDAADEAGSSGN